MGGENSTKNWKTEHDFIWWNFHSGSWRNMSHFIMRCLSWDFGENKFLQSVVKKCLMEFDERKSFEVMEIMLCVWETSEKFEFSYLEIFSHSTNFNGMENFENSS